MRDRIDANRRSRRPGFTMMEALIALVLLFLAILGMGALAGAAVKTNLNSHDTTQALFIADRLLDMMQTESLAWNDAVWNPTADTGSNETTNLALLRNAPTDGWREATQDLGLVGGVRAFDPEGTMVAPNAPRAHYCAHYRLTWLVLNEAMRAEVRVYWLRRGADGSPFGFRNDCGATDPNAMAVAREFHCVANATILSRNGGL